MRERESIGIRRWSGRGRVRERRMGVHVCERERVGNKRGGRERERERVGGGRESGRGRVSERQSRGWERREGGRVCV